MQEIRVEVQERQATEAAAAMMVEYTIGNAGTSDSPLDLTNVWG